MKKIGTAVIMAAGMGIRLKEMGKLTPKGFIRLGERAILEESVEKLSRAGVGRIVIVTGHLADFYTDLEGRSNGLIETVHNSRFSDSGSLYSLYLARDKVKEDFLLLESDLIYEDRALQELLEHPQDDVVLLSGPTYSGDEVYVETRNGHLLNMSKDRSLLDGKVAGELVGISKISARFYSVLIGQAELLLRSSLQVQYEDGLVAASQLHPLHVHVVDDLLWAEIDDEDQLQRARDRVYPKLFQSGRSV